MSAILRRLSQVRTICSTPLLLEGYSAPAGQCVKCHLLQCWARKFTTNCSKYPKSIGLQLRRSSRFISTGTKSLQETKSSQLVDLERRIIHKTEKSFKGKEQGYAKHNANKKKSAKVKLENTNQKPDDKVQSAKTKKKHKNAKSKSFPYELEKPSNQISNQTFSKKNKPYKGKHKFAAKDNKNVKDQVYETSAAQPKNEVTKQKSKHKKKKHKKLTQKRKEELLKRVTLDEFGPLTEFDFSEETTTEVEPNEEIVEELEQLLRDPSLSQDVSETLQKVLLDYKSALKGEKGAFRATFWKPEQLTNMKEIEQAFRELCVWQGLHAQKKISSTVIESINVERKLKAYEKTLVSYVDACISANMVSAAHTIVLGPHYNKRLCEKRGIPQITDVNIYETVMQAWAKQGRLQQIQDLAKVLAAKNLKPSLKTYAAVLEVLGRQPKCDKKLAQAVIVQAEKEGLDLGLIPHECHLSDNSLKFIEKGIKSVKPTFSYSSPRSPLGYECSLVKHLSTQTVIARDQYSAQLMENPHKGALTEEELLEGFRQQLELETREQSAVEPIMSVGKNDPDSKRLYDILLSKWRTDLTKAFETELHLQKVLFTKLGKIPRYSPFMYPYLKMLPVETYVNFMIEELKKVPHMMPVFNYPLLPLVYVLGENIFTYYEKTKLSKTDYKKRLERVYVDYLQFYNEDKLATFNQRELFQAALAKNNLESLECSANLGKEVPSNIVRMIGKFLYDLMLSHVKVNSNIFKEEKYWKEGVELPMWFTTTAMIKGRKQEMRQQTVLQLHPFMKKLVSNVTEELTFPVNIFPSLTPPVPWMNATHGGYLFPAGKETHLVRRTSDTSTQQALISNLPDNKLYPVLDSLNALASTPWKINEPILDLILDVYREGGNADLDVPIHLSKLPELPVIKGLVSPEEYKERKLLKQRRHETHALWMSDLYRLSLANKYRGKVFWLPHNLDFRGRVYAIPPHFNHLGNDLARSILVFAKAKPLGENGLDWLKIHLVNLTGMKKRCSNSERLEFANELMPEILDSADKPFEGNLWWQGSEEPWQTLAVCKEITNAVRSGDPAHFLSRFPVHQDGSCNGLQHYAALGRDAGGAESVNLAPSDVPKDVYSDIVVLVEQERQNDADGEGPDAEIAKILEGFIERKVIKQTIMTTVYGVTRYGGKLQIERQLEKIKEFPQEHTFDASWYLVQKTFHCLHQKFSATKEIQNWLTLSAQVISRLSMQQVHWITPLGWPVLQPYQNIVTVLKELPRVEINLQDVASEEEWLEKMTWMQKKRYQELLYGKPNLMKQRNAYPPNFIHSLDSTHMMLTALHCLRYGVTFASVHDCFWTHASDIPIMNKVCREQFIQLHNQPILEDLAKYMSDNFGCHSGNLTTEDLHPVVKNFVNHVLLRVPPRGDFQLESVMDSPYFFS